jgi:hypothetical protein
MGDNTGDEVDLSFDESSENDDDEAGEGSGLYHSWSFLGPSRSGSGRIVTRSPSSEMLNSRPRSSTRGTYPQFILSMPLSVSVALWSGNAILRMVSLFPEIRSLAKACTGRPAIPRVPSLIHLTSPPPISSR